MVIGGFGGHVQNKRINKIKIIIDIACLQCFVNSEKFTKFESIAFSGWGGVLGGFCLYRCRAFFTFVVWISERYIGVLDN